MQLPDFETLLPIEKAATTRALNRCRRLSGQIAHSLGGVREWSEAKSWLSYTPRSKWRLKSFKQQKNGVDYLAAAFFRLNLACSRGLARWSGAQQPSQDIAGPLPRLKHS